MAVLRRILFQKGFISIQIKQFCPIYFKALRMSVHMSTEFPPVGNLEIDGLLKGCILRSTGAWSLSSWPLSPYVSLSCWQIFCSLAIMIASSLGTCSPTFRAFMNIARPSWILFTHSWPLSSLFAKWFAITSVMVPNTGGIGSIPWAAILKRSRAVKMFKNSNKHRVGPCKAHQKWLQSGSFL